MSNDQQARVPEELSEEGNRNLLEFFELLLEVDMRINPHLYKKEPPEEKK